MSFSDQEKSNSPRLVWFVLVDSTDGLPYKGTTASSVSLPPSFVVDQFRDAVKAKYDQPDYLKNIPSGALIVFKNKTAFDKRNDDEGKEEPLESSKRLGPIEENEIGLGETEEDSLRVLVPAPSLISQPAVSNHGRK
jgi:hypothetical protein